MEGLGSLQILISVPEDITPERIVLESSLEGAVTPEGLWAAPETVMVSLHVCMYPGSGPGVGTLDLLLPDGSAATPRGPHSRAFEVAEGGGTAWFEVPADIASATARIELGVDGTALGTEEIAVSVTRE